MYVYICIYPRLLGSRPTPHKLTPLSRWRETQRRETRTSPDGETRTSIPQTPPPDIPPGTRNPKPETPNPKPQTRTSKPETRNQKPETPGVLCAPLRGLMGQCSSHRMYVLISLRKSTPPQNRQLIVYDYWFKQ